MSKPASAGAEKTENETCAGRVTGRRSATQQKDWCPPHRRWRWGETLASRRRSCHFRRPSTASHAFDTLPSVLSKRGRPVSGTSSKPEGEVSRRVISITGFVSLYPVKRERGPQLANSPTLTRCLTLAIGALLLSCVSEPQTQVTPATVEGYKKAMEDRLGPLWYKRVELNEEEAIPGTVKVTFRIPAEGGSARKFRVVSNTGNKIDELTAWIAVRQLKAPPIPPAVLRQLGQDHLEFEESFTIFYNSPTPSPNPRSIR